MAGWLRGRTKLTAVLSLLKDHTAASLARASGPFSRLQLSIVTATNHHESLPDEKHVEEILAAGAGSRMQVSFGTRLIVKRLHKTQHWAVAAKCLIILHRSVLDGGFLFQDLLAYSSLREGREYLSFPKCKPELGLSLWVKRYARFLDERLRCSHALKTHFDNRWTGEVTRTRVEFVESGELIHQLEYLQHLLHAICQCEPEGYTGDHPVIQGALILVVMDSFKVQDEIRFRMKELLGRATTLDLSESLALLHCCKRCESQSREVQTFLESCKELKLLSDIPLNGESVVSKGEIQKLTETIQQLQTAPRAPGFARSVSSGAKALSGPLPPFIPLENTPFPLQGPVTLTRTSSQPMSHVPRRVAGTNGTPNGGFPFVPEDLLPSRHSSFNTDSSSNGGQAHAPANTFRDLITF